MLGENSMKVAREMGVKVFRLTSGSRNKAAHRQIARIEFEEVCRFSTYEPAMGARRGRRARRASPEEVGEVTKLIEDSKEFKLGHGVFWHDFGAASLTPDVVRRLVQEGEVWRHEDAVAVARTGGEGAEVWEEVCFVGGPLGDALELVKALSGRLKGAAERWVFVPHGSPLVHALRQSGFKRNFSHILFERNAAKG
jgi:hypothetical protein